MNHTRSVLGPGVLYTERLRELTQEILAVARAVCEEAELIVGDPAHPPGHFFRTAGIDLVQFADHVDVVRRRQQRARRAGVEPGHTAAETFDTEFTALEVGVVQRRDLKLTSVRRSQRLRQLDDAAIVEVQAGDGDVRRCGGRLLDDTADASLGIELDDAEPFRVSDFVAEDDGAGREFGRRAKNRGEPMSEEDVVAEDQADRIIGDEHFADEERLREATRFRLDRIGDRYAPLRAVAEEASEGVVVFGGGDDQDLPDAGEHEHRQRVVDHRLVIDVKQLLADDVGGGAESSGSAASQDNALADAHGEPFVGVRCANPGSPYECRG